MLAVRPGLHRCGLMAAAFLFSMSAEAARAYTPEQEQLCSGDAMRLCSSEIPDIDRITACMERRKSELSPGCRSVFHAPAATPRATGPATDIRPAVARRHSHERTGRAAKSTENRKKAARAKHPARKESADAK